MLFNTISVKKGFKYHEMTKWQTPVWSYLTYCARRSSTISNFCANGRFPSSSGELHRTITDYIKGLLPLKDKDPWKKAFEDPQIRKVIDVIQGTQSELPNKNDKDKSVEDAVQTHTLVTTAVARMAQTSKPQEENVQQGVAKDVHQKYKFSSNSVQSEQGTAKNSQQISKSSNSLAQTVIQKRTLCINIIPLTTHQISSFQKGKSQQETPKNENKKRQVNHMAQKSVIKKVKLQYNISESSQTLSFVASLLCCVFPFWSFDLSQ